MQSSQLNTMCATYNHYYVIYNKNKTKATQLIPSIMWKDVYVANKVEYPKSKFQEEILKERFWETLRELKIGTSNEEGSKNVVCKMKKS